MTNRTPGRDRPGAPGWRDTFALPPLIDEVVKTIEPLAAKNGNQLAVHCHATIGTMHADQMRLRQALLNLISNANKFTEKVHRHHRRSPATGERPRLGLALGRRHRHRHDGGADGQAVPGVFPGVLDHSEQVRRHGPRAPDQPEVLSDDGGRHYGGERAGQGLGVHRALAGKRAVLTGTGSELFRVRRRLYVRHHKSINAAAGQHGRGRTSRRCP